MGFFFVVVLVLIGLIHFYLWKRLVRDTTRPGWGRRIGTGLIVVLAVLVPATLGGVRAGYLQWLSWPGYLWIAVMFYLLVTLVALELPRLAAMLLWARRPRTAAPATTTVSGTDQAELQPAGPAPAMGATGTLEAESPSAGPVLASGSTSTTSTLDAAGSGDDDGADRPGIERRLLLARGAAIFAGLTAAGVTGYGVRTALGPLQIDRAQIPIAKLPRAMDGIRLAVVSDIHIGPLTGANHARRIVQAINSVNADLVCVVGDLVDGSVAELGRDAAPLADIESRFGNFFVTGNHEYYSGHEEWVAEVARLGIRPLRNERLEINGLDLAGVNDVNGAEFGDGPDYARTLGDRDPNRPIVLMAHQPVAAIEAAPFGVDLQLSGHTHGGQMVPFNYLVKLQQPVVSGLGTVDGMPVYVTNGAGFWGPPVRVGAPPQVTVIELRTK